jgi:hypothetical protein
MFQGVWFWYGYCSKENGKHTPGGIEKLKQFL